MRKKQRDKDGHKDPLIIENSRLQAELKSQIDEIHNSLDEIVKHYGPHPPELRIPKRRKLAPPQSKDDVIIVTSTDEKQKFNKIDPSSQAKIIKVSL